MAEELKDSGAVTALSVIGLVFGLIGMLGSFIPCLGSLAFFVGIPAAIASGIALAIACSWVWKTELQAQVCNAFGSRSRGAQVGESATRDVALAVSTAATSTCRPE